jgi:hypothetical protein
MLSTRGKPLHRILFLILTVSFGIAGAASAGANWLVAGSALYRDPDGLEHAVKDLRARAEAAATS